MEKKRNSHSRLSRRMSKRVPAADCTRKIGHVNQAVVTSECDDTTMHIDNTIHQAVSHSMCVSYRENTLNEVSAISRMTMGLQAPGAQCSTADLAISMGPLHSTMEYPQHSTPERVPSVSVIQTHNRHNSCKQTKSNTRLTPVGEESTRTSRSQSPSSICTESARHKKSDSSKEKSRNMSRLSMMSCFSGKTADANFKSKKFSSMPKAPPKDVLTVNGHVSSCNVMRTSNNSIYSMAVNGGSWMEDISASQVEELPGYRVPTGMRPHDSVSCCTEHNATHTSRRVKSSNRTSSMSAHAPRELNSSVTINPSEGHYVTMRHENGPCRSILNSNTSDDSFFNSPMPLGSRPPCIGKEASPATMPCSLSRYSSGYQSRRHNSTRSNRSTMDSSYIQDTNTSVVQRSRLDVSRWPTLAVF